jgi:hypothetical protein
LVSLERSKKDLVIFKKKFSFLPFSSKKKGKRNFENTDTGNRLLRATLKTLGSICVTAPKSWDTFGENVDASWDIFGEKDGDKSHSALRIKIKSCVT